MAIIEKVVYNKRKFNLTEKNVLNMMCQNAILLDALKCFKDCGLHGRLARRMQRMGIIVTDIFERNNTYFK